METEFSEPPILDLKDVDDVESVFPPKPHNPWLAHLTIVMTVVFICRLLRAFGLISRFHQFNLFMYGMVTPSGRRNRLRRLQLNRDLYELRAQLKELNMFHQFAAYSRTERKIKAAQNELDKLSPKSISQTLIHVTILQVVLSTLEVCIYSWLIFRSPQGSVTSSEWTDAKLRLSYMLPIIFLLYYVPSRLITLFWIGLCHFSLTPFVIRIHRLLTRKLPDISSTNPVSDPEHLASMWKASAEN